MLRVGANKAGTGDGVCFCGALSPEPGSLCLLGAGIAGLLIGRRRGPRLIGVLESN